MSQVPNAMPAEQAIAKAKEILVSEEVLNTNNGAVLTMRWLMEIVFASTNTIPSKWDPSKLLCLDAAYNVLSIEKSYRLSIEKIERKVLIPSQKLMVSGYSRHYYQLDSLLRYRLQHKEPAPETDELWCLAEATVLTATPQRSVYRVPVTIGDTVHVVGYGDFVLGRPTFQSGDNINLIPVK